MNALVPALKRLAADTGGQDLLEYGLLAALISVFLFVAIQSLGQTIDAVFWQAIAAGMAGAV